MLFIIYARQQLIMSQLFHFRIHIHNSQWPLCINLQLEKRKKMFHYLQTMAKITKLN